MVQPQKSLVEKGATGLIRSRPVSLAKPISAAATLQPIHAVARHGGLCVPNRAGHACLGLAGFEHHRARWHRHRPHTSVGSSGNRHDLGRLDSLVAARRLCSGGRDERYDKGSSSGDCEKLSHNMLLHWTAGQRPMSPTSRTKAMSWSGTIMRRVTSRSNLDKLNSWQSIGCWRRSRALHLKGLYFYKGA